MIKETMLLAILASPFLISQLEAHPKPIEKYNEPLPAPYLSDILGPSSYGNKYPSNKYYEDNGEEYELQNEFDFEEGDSNCDSNKGDTYPVRPYSRYAEKKDYTRSNDADGWNSPIRIYYRTPGYNAKYKYEKSNYRRYDDEYRPRYGIQTSPIQPYHSYLSTSYRQPSYELGYESSNRYKDTYGKNVRYGRQQNNYNNHDSRSHYDQPSYPNSEQYVQNASQHNNFLGYNTNNQPNYSNHQTYFGSSHYEPNSEMSNMNHQNYQTNPIQPDYKLINYYSNTHRVMPISEYENNGKSATYGSENVNTYGFGSNPTNLGYHPYESSTQYSSNNRPSYMESTSTQRPYIRTTKKPGELGEPNSSPKSSEKSKSSH